MILAGSLYFLALFAVAMVFYRKSKTNTDFILGGRSLNFYVTALSAHASDMSSWLFMAYPALIIASGGQGIWAGLGLIAGMWANWQFVAPRLRRDTEKLKALTISDFLAKRFGDKSGLLRVVGSSLSLLFFIAYVSAGMVGIGLLFEAILGLDPMVGMLVALVAVVLYTLIGGFASIAWVDMFQALFLLGAIITVPIVAWVKMDVALPSFSFAPEGGISTALMLSLGWGLGYFGQTHILSKFMGIDDAANLRKSKWVGMTWQVLCLGAATLVGLVAAGYFAGGLANSELAFVMMVKSLFNPFVGGLILCGIFAATISTMDSQILVLTSVLSEDVYKRYVNRSASPKKLVWVSRLCVVLVGLASFVLAMTSGSTVMSLVFYSWAGLGAAFGPVILAALYSKRINGVGALFGMVVGGLTAAVWPQLHSEIPALIPAFMANGVVMYTASAVAKLRGWTWATSQES